MQQMTLQAKIREIVGSSLSSVEFVQDYVQFRFDGPCVTAFTPPGLKSAIGVLRPGTQGYLEGVCSRIGVRVAAVRVTDEELIIEFVDSSAITVSLRKEHYIGPEAINYVAGDGTIWVA
jgi:hypothetical protein